MSKAPQDQTEAQDQPAARTLQRPYVVAGPCSAESLTQLRYTARALKRTGRVDFFRAGVWKPRSRPGDFEGLGVPALSWLRLIQQEEQLPVATEVASPEHVEAVLKAGLQGVWIGARTTVNPFVVQEIASALAGSDVQIFVKNPVNPDLGLWVGAVERLLRTGLSRVTAVHRGFSVYGPSGYRNDPIWTLPLAFRRSLPQIPLLCDPSHISGARALVPALAQRAMDLQFDGLMIEVHPQPDTALSDAAQQLTPSDFEKMLQTLVLYSPEVGDAQLREQIAVLRGEIDQADEQMLKALSTRMQWVERIGELKRAGGLSALQPRRWEELMASVIQKGGTMGLSSDFVEQLFFLIHHESLQQQLAEPRPAGSQPAKLQLTEPELAQSRSVALSLAEAAQRGDWGLMQCEHTQAPAPSITLPRMGRIEEAAAHWNPQRSVMLVDARVAALHADRLPALPRIEITALESHKTLDMAAQLYRRLLDMGVDRSYSLIAIGGGLVCDLAGFVAATYLRGIPCIYVPTTLLAQADAAIGGKNGVNLDGYKNMVGSIVQPAEIICDTAFLPTLPSQEIRSGLGEIIKHALIADPSLLHYIETQAEALLQGVPEAFVRLITASHKIKCGIVQADEREQGRRRILNFGHSLGHAIEALQQQQGESQLLAHGEAVALGMLYALELSEQHLGLDSLLRPRVQQLMQQLGLPTACPYPIEKLQKAMQKDKKKDGTVLRMILLKTLGQPIEYRLLPY